MFGYIGSPSPNEGRKSHRFTAGQGNPSGADAALTRRSGGATALAHSLREATMCTAAACLIVAALTLPGSAQTEGSLKVQHFKNPSPSNSPIVALWSDQIAAHNSIMAKVGGPGAPKSGENAPVYTSSVSLSAGNTSLLVSMWLTPSTCEGVGNGPQLGDVQPQLCQARISVTRDGQTKLVKAQFCNLLYEYDDPAFDKKLNHVNFSFNASTGVLTSTALVNGKAEPACDKSMSVGG